MKRQILSPVALVVVVTLVCGCGTGTSSVAGKVTYQGKPVVWGSITLQAADGSIHQIGLNSDGTYRLERVPVGLAKVGVSSPDPKPSARARGGEDARVATGPTPPPGAWFQLPDKFADPATSGVTLAVGSSSGDIELK